MKATRLHRRRHVARERIAGSAWLVAFALACSGQDVVLGEFEAKSSAGAQGGTSGTGALSGSGGVPAGGASGASSSGAGGTSTGGASGTATGGQSGGHSAECTDELQFPDPVLEGTIRGQLRIEAGPIPASAATEILELHIDSTELGSIEGIECLTNLQLLNLRASVDLTPLAPLTELRSLHVPARSQAQVDSIALLTELLEVGLELDFDRNLEPLQALPDLISLSLSFVGTGETGISARLQPISVLTALRTLRIRNLRPETFEMPDMDFVTAMSGLEWLDIQGTTLVDVASVVELTGLVVLGLDGNRIADVTPLAALVNLQQLGLSANQISDVTALGGLSGLTMLWLQSNAISDVSALSGLGNLRNVRLDQNQISSVTALAQSDVFRPTLVEVQGNPLDCVRFEEELLLFGARNVGVQHDCPP